MILRHQDRAVTADDFRELANRTPGVAVGRAECCRYYRRTRRRRRSSRAW